jgi:hypothetical protein
MVADKYQNFAALRAGEPAHTFKILWEDRNLSTTLRQLRPIN